jgi:glycosyltransferase involved in cell wall biosynthesis
MVYPIGNQVLTIGMPVYNGETTIEEAISSILSQSFQDFVLVISDNASTDGTPDIIEKMARMDCRIRYFPQTSNIGALANFLFVADKIQTPYFMWFASDDIIDSRFIATCIDILEGRANLGMAFSSINNIDSKGRVIREYPELHFLSGRASWRTVSRFVLSPELFGKANLFYSIYRRKIVQKALAQHGLKDAWGSDMSFVLSALIYGGGIYIFPEVLFKKRYIRAGDDLDDLLKVEIPGDLLSQSCPISHFDEYEKVIVDAARDSRYCFIVAMLMRYRYQKLLRLKRFNEDGILKLPFWDNLKLSVSEVALSVVHAFQVTF